jgi:Acetyltransferase (GNAT) domain
LPRKRVHTVQSDRSGKIVVREAVACDERQATAPASAVRAAFLQSLSVEICGSDIPPALLLAAEAVVDTPFACLAYVRAFSPELVPQLRHAVVRNSGQLVGILSFYPRRETLVVVNRLVRLPDEALDASAAAMLAQHPAMRSVAFNDLHNEEARAPAQRLRSLTWRTIDCVVAELPSTYSEYLANFGSTTRKNLRYCARRLEREVPGVNFRICRREKIGADAVAAIVQLNHRRMASKNRTSGIDELYASRLAAVTRSHGVACIATDGPTILAGTLCTQVGNGWTLHVIAHDPRFDHVRLGLLCLLKAVQEAIESGASRFNLLWGVANYKLLFGGKVATLRARRYYRNTGSQLLALGDIRDYAIQLARRQLSLWRRRHRAS